MEKNSEEELFIEVVTGLKDQGLAVNVSRNKRSEFVYESQSQESFRKSPSSSELQLYTYEVNRNGEMLLLAKTYSSDRLENVPLEVLSDEHSCQDNGGRDTLNNVVIYHKYLEPGHTQMEVDSVHAAIERGIQKYDAIYVPSQYADITRKSRKDPYDVNMLKFDFFKKFDDPKVMRYESIRPGKKKGDPVVTDLKVLLYKPDGKIYFKINICDENYSLLPSCCRPRNINFPITTYEQLFKDSPKLTSCKFNDLQALKTVIPSDYHSFYDNLPHM